MARLGKYLIWGTMVGAVLLGLVLSAVLGKSQPAYCDDLHIIAGGGTMVSIFSWTPIALADEYKVNLYGSDGKIVASRWIKAPATSIELNMGNFGTGSSFQWEVEALLKGDNLCTTDRTEMISKPGDPNPPRNNVPAPVATEAVIPPTPFIPR